MPTRLPFPGVRLLRRSVLVLALLVPGTIPASSAHAARPTLILAPGSGSYGPGCAGRMMALGDGFPEGAGVALFALKSSGAPFTVGNIRTLLATVAVQHGRFVGGYVGLDSLLCAERGGDPAAYPDAATIDIVAALGTDVGGPWPHAGTELARATFIVDRSRPLPASQRCFAETLLCVRGRFHDYWLANGGLARNGFPLTDERIEALEDGNTYTVQYFERVRLELHPENAPPYDVLLGQFGRRVLSARFTTDRSGYERATAPVPAVAGQSYFPVTGHNLGGAFLVYWQANGGLAQFGFPLTEAFRETLDDQRDYQVQYFERGRLELHPENPAPYDVLLGQFGRQIVGEAALLGGDLGRLYLTDADVRDRIGRPLRAAAPTPAATQPFERGRMIYLDRTPFRGQAGRFILVLVGEPADGRVLNSFVPLEPYFVDTWAEGQPVGGGGGPRPGLSEPTRGFGQVWRENDQSGVRQALGYATAPEAGYTATAQEFERGLLLTVDTAEGRFIYAIDVRRISNGSAPAAAYRRYPASQR